MLSLYFRSENAQIIHRQKRRLGYTYKVKVILLRSQFSVLVLNSWSSQAINFEPVITQLTAKLPAGVCVLEFTKTQATNVNCFNGIFVIRGSF